MTSEAYRKILAIFLLIGFVLPQFSAFALLGDITNIGECALRNRLKAYLQQVIAVVVDFIKDVTRATVCGVISFFTARLINCKVQKTTSGENKTLIAKETIEDAVARCIARQALTRMTNGMLNIVREKGRDGGPVYVQDWRNFTLQGQQRGENIWRGLLYIAANGDPDFGVSPLLCSHIRESQAFNSLQPTQVSGLIQSGLNRRVDSLQEYLVTAKCDPEVEKNYNIFTQNFSQGGGWDMWKRMLQPQNNIYGSIELAYQELTRQRSIEEKANTDEAIAGSGFTGKRGENASDSCLSFDISGRCVVYKNIQTPGFILAESTNKALNSELDWIVSSDEIHELMTDMFFVMISRLSNLGGSEPAKPPIEIFSGPPETLPRPNDSEAFCAENCIQTYAPGPELNTCIAACYGEESPQPPSPPGPEPNSLESDVRDERQNYGTPITKQQLSDLLNAVAWKNQDDGWGLLSKSGGNNCPFASGPIACDILFHRPSGLHYDVLVDSEGAATPTWRLVGPISTSRWLAPVQP